MSQQQTRDFVRRFIERFQGERDLTAIDEYMSLGFVNHSSPPGIPPDREGVKIFFRAFFDAFPDFRAEIVEQHVEGDLVATRKLFHGTHRGELMGIPPTGRTIRIEVTDILRVADDRITDHWGVYDGFGMLQQLGVIPGDTTRSTTETQEGAVSTTDQNKTTLRGIYDTFNDGNLDRLDGIVHRDCVDHEGFPGAEPGVAGLKQTIALMRSAFPDLRLTVQDTMAEGDRVVARLTMEGTQRGEFMGLPPSGRSFKAACVDIVRFENGLAVEHWGVSDMLGILQQLGAVPTQEPS